MVVRRVQRTKDRPVSTSSRERPAAVAGLEQDAVEAIWRAVMRYDRARMQPAMALCIRVDGHVVLDRSVGYAQGVGPDDSGAKIAVTPDTPFNLFSASKPITAMVVHEASARGAFQIDDCLARYLPEFDQPGKRDITVRHVLSHRAGLPRMPVPPDLDRLSDHKWIRKQLRDAPMTTISGRGSAYHAVVGGYILWELIRETTGQCLRALQRQWVCEPMGLELMNYGLPEQHRNGRAIDACTGPPPPFPISTILKNALGLSHREMVSVTNDPRFLDGVVPAANVFATANQACRYFEMLRRGGLADNGARIFAQSTVDRATRRAHFSQLDAVMMLPIRYSAGFMLGDHLVSPLGPRSEGAFGHMGFSNVMVWADPARRMSVAFLNSGKPFITPEQILWFRIILAIGRHIPRRAS